MPSSHEILAGLTEIANDAFPLAVAWHVAVVLAAAALAAGWRPSRRLAGILISLPAASVAVLAIAYGNPFNGAVFGLVTIALAATAARLEPRPIGLAAPIWAVLAGGAIVLFGWVYPHFLQERSSVAYLYAAPTGLVPCPTLSLMIGISLLAGGLESRTWSMVLSAAGLFYGVFGAFRLGVHLDVALLAGALTLLALAALPPERRLRGRATPRRSSG